MTKIEWTDESWNPVVGCTKIAAGCKNCYAERMAVRQWHIWKYEGGCPCNEPDVERAYDYCLCAWLGRNGVAGTHSYNQGFCVRFTANGGHSAKRWRSVIESIPAWHHRLLNVTILNRDAFEILPRIEDKEGTVIYVDPPYLKKGAKFIHDFEDADHEKLASMLGRFKETRVVLSYYDDERLNRLYPAWTRHKIEISKVLANQGGRGKKDVRVVEVLLTNSTENGLFSNNQ